MAETCFRSLSFILSLALSFVLPPSLLSSSSLLYHSSRMGYQEQEVSTLCGRDLRSVSGTTRPPSLRRLFGLLLDVLPLSLLIGFCLVSPEPVPSADVDACPPVLVPRLLRQTPPPKKTPPMTCPCHSTQEERGQAGSGTVRLPVLESFEHFLKPVKVLGCCQSPEGGTRTAAASAHTHTLAHTPSSRVCV